MGMQTRVLLVILETFFFTIFVLNECKKLDGYKFPVYSTPFCPRNESEWNKRSSAINCNKTNGYTCLPNENLTELLEFCYTQPWLLIEEGYCLYLERKGSYVDSYSCRHFLHGCHNTSYQSIKIYEHPTCISIGNGCFLAEQSCKSSSKTTYRPETTENEKDDLFWSLTGITVFIFFFSSLMLYLYRIRRICKQGPDIENAEEITSLINGDVKVKPNNILEEGVVVTEGIANILEKMESQKFIICLGAIGCGKTTALEYVTNKYRKNGWTVEWMEESFDESCTERLHHCDLDKTVICIDNLFGVFGCQVFLNDMFNKFKLSMREIVSGRGTPIVLLGIHQHVYNEISPEHYLFPVDGSLFIDLNNMSKSEALQIYKLQQEKNKSKQYDISFDDFLEMIEQRSSEVGTPFQTLMISAAPSVFGTKQFCRQPFQRLTEHISNLYNTERELFCSLVYIMCVTIFNLSSDELDKDVANTISTSLTKNTIAHYLSKLAPYTHDDGNAIEIKHDIIAIALIHALMKQSVSPWTVLKVYDNTRILELVRPADDRYVRPHQFVIPLSREMFTAAISVLKEKNV